MINRFLVGAIHLRNAPHQMPEKEKCDYPGCDGKHEPNEESKKALAESREGKGTIFSSLDEFWKAMGITPNA